jgi:hypothetical protein
MSSSARAERVAERDKLKQRQAGQEPPKKKSRKEGTQHATSPADSPSRGGIFEDSSRQPPTRDALLGSSGPSHALSTLPSPEDYNERTPERTNLLTCLKSHLKVDHITSTFWACCQLCDTECLEYLVKTAEMRPNNVLAYVVSLSTIPLLCKFTRFQGLLRLYQRFIGTQRFQDTSGGYQWQPRLMSGADQRKIQMERKPTLLVYFVQSANPSSANHSAQTNFWRLLGVFWADDRVSEWRNNTGVDTCFNLISLGAEAHWH